MTDSVSTSTSSTSLQEALPRAETGPNYEALETYVSKNFMDSYTSWTPGTQDIPLHKVEGISGSEFQVHVMHRGSRIIKFGRWLQTSNGSSVEDASGKLLEGLEETERSAMQKLESYIDNERYTEKGFIIKVEDTWERPGKQAHAVLRYKVQVLLNPDFPGSRGTPMEFVLGVENGATPGIAANKVLHLLKFKRKAGFMWVDERLIKEANLRYRCEAAYAALVDRQTRGEELTAKEQLIIGLFKLKLDQPRLVWLGKTFVGKADYLGGELPKLSKKLHKVLRKNGLESDTKENSSIVSGRSQKKERIELVAYEAVEAYERIRRRKAQRKNEERSRSKTRTSELLKLIGIDKRGRTTHDAAKSVTAPDRWRGRPITHRSCTR